MVVKFAETKRILMDVLSLTDEVNDKGQYLPRTKFKKEHLRGLQEAKEKIIEHVVLFLEEENDIKKIPAKEYQSMPRAEQGKVVGEEYRDGELAFSEKAIAAIKFYLKEREDLPEVKNGEALEEIESLLAL